MLQLWIELTISYDLSIFYNSEASNLEDLTHYAVTWETPPSQQHLPSRDELTPFHLQGWVSCCFQMCALSIYLRHTKISILGLAVVLPQGGPTQCVLMISASASLSVGNHSGIWFVRNCVMLGPSFPSGSPWTQVLFLLLWSSSSANFVSIAINNFDCELNVHSTCSVGFFKASLSTLSALVSSLRDCKSDWRGSKRCSRQISLSLMTTSALEKCLSIAVSISLIISVESIVVVCSKVDDFALFLVCLGIKWKVLRNFLSSCAVAFHNCPSLRINNLQLLQWLWA